MFKFMSDIAKRLCERLDEKTIARLVGLAIASLLFFGLIEILKALKPYEDPLPFISLIPR